MTRRRKFERQKQTFGIFAALVDLVPGLSGYAELTAQTHHLLAIQETSNESETVFHDVALLPGHGFLPQMEKVLPIKKQTASLGPILRTALIIAGRMFERWVVIPGRTTTGVLGKIENIPGQRPPVSVSPNQVHSHCKVSVYSEWDYPDVRKPDPLKQLAKTRPGGGFFVLSEWPLPGLAKSRSPGAKMLNECY